jgi:hypothetical protein
MSSILSFVALKLSDVKRYSDDDRWCMDRGLGLSADLNVLPKSAWLSSYSSRVTKEMNMGFLKSLHEIWLSHGLLSDTCNLIFDSKFTNYENLSRLDQEGIKFITIRRRGKKILDQISRNNAYKTLRVEAIGMKSAL